MLVGGCVGLSGLQRANAVTQIDTSKTFRLTFFGTSLVLETKFMLSYKETEGNEVFKLRWVGPDTPVIAEMATLNYSSLEKSLIEFGVGKGIDGTITRFSVYEVFYWIFLEVYGEPKRPLAGTLNLATEVQYYKTKEDLGFAYEDRVKTTDSLIDGFKFLPIKIAALKSERWNASQKLERLKKENSILEKEELALKQGTEAETAAAYEKVRDLRDNDIPMLIRLKQRLEIIKGSTIDSGLKRDSIINLIQQGFRTLGINEVLSAKDDRFDELKELIDGNLLDPISSAEIEYLNRKIKELKLEAKSRVEKAIISNKLIFDSLSENRLSRSEVDSINLKISKLENELEALGQRLINPPISKVIRTDIQIERGFIENVKVILEINGRETIFENSFAIGFTSKSNYRAFAHLKLFARLGNDRMHIYLSDVIRNYDNEIDLYTRDYSPSDTLIKVDPSVNPRVNVYKASIIDLLDVKFYTDLEGLANKQPNGLVQFEACRKLNINTVRKQIKNEYNWGPFNYLLIYGTLNKIENNFRYLKLQNQNVIVNGKLVSPSYATTLDFLQYRNLTLGTEMNLYLYDMPSLKNTITIDLGFQYGHTPVLDYVRRFDSLGVFQQMGDSVKMQANLFTVYPRIGIELFPERRLGVSFAYQPQYTRIYTNNAYKQIASYAKSDASLLPIEPAARFTHMFEMFLRLEINKQTSSRFFFRGRFHWQHGDVNTYFPQLQLGYSHNLKIPKLTQ